MMNSEVAEKSMQHVVEALRNSELQRLDEISSIDVMLALLENLADRNWYSTYSQLHQKWKVNDAEVVAVEKANREALKL